MLVQSALSPLAGQAKAFDVTLDINIPAEAPTHVLLDANKIAWCLATLVGNGLRYVPHGTRLFPGGRVSLAVECTREGEVVFQVTDDGPGIPTPVLSHLLDSAGDRVRSGLALGLIDDIVKAHGGRLEIQNRTDTEHGTRIRFTIPPPLRAEG
jgi:signal transduction histidine kinase